MSTPEPTTAEAQAAGVAADTVASLPEHYFELYKLAVEMADRTSARRLTANTFFVTVNTGLTALLSARSFGWYVAVAGVVLCAAWWALIKSYRDLNRAKFVVINAMEERLPARIFSDEWSHLNRGPVSLVPTWQALRQWLGRYWELGIVEQLVPAIFAIIYLINLGARLPR